MRIVLSSADARSSGYGVGLLPLLGVASHHPHQGA